MVKKPAKERIKVYSLACMYTCEAVYHVQPCLIIKTVLLIACFLLAPLQFGQVSKALFK
jgi:hypothetical protein